MLFNNELDRSTQNRRPRHTYFEVSLVAILLIDAENNTETKGRRKLQKPENVLKKLFLKRKFLLISNGRGLEEAWKSN